MPKAAFILASISLCLAALALTWNIWSFWLSRGRVRVVGEALPDGGGGVVRIRVHNRGRTPVTIMAVACHVPYDDRRRRRNRPTVMFPKVGESESGLGTVPGGETRSWTIDLGGVLRECGDRDLLITDTWTSVQVGSRSPQRGPRTVVTAL